MKLQKGDWVRTETGELGRVIMIYQLSAFVEINLADRGNVVVSYLTSQLTKIDEPEQPGPE